MADGLSQGKARPKRIFQYPDFFPFFLKYTQQYQTLNTLHARDKVVVQWYNTDAVMWSHNEVHLLGDLLEKLQPHIIGLSTRCVYEKSIVDILEQMRRVDGAITTAGGHDASFRPELYLDHLDFACIGEGEEALTSLAEAVDQGLDGKTIPNLAYRENAKVIYNDLVLPEDTKDHFFSEGMKDVAHYLIDLNQAHKVDYLLRDVHRQSKVTEYQETKTLYTEVLDYLEAPERDRVEKLLTKIDTSLQDPRSRGTGSMPPEPQPTSRHRTPVHAG